MLKRFTNIPDNTHGISPSHLNVFKTRRKIRFKKFFFFHKISSSKKRKREKFGRDFYQLFEMSNNKKENVVFGINIIGFFASFFSIKFLVQIFFF